MADKELEKAFRKEFECDCYDYSCELRDCSECETYKDCFAEYKESLGYYPTITIDD